VVHKERAKALDLLGRVDGTKGDLGEVVFVVRPVADAALRGMGDGGAGVVVVVVVVGGGE
jgi:hypothetical protein